MEDTVPQFSHLLEILKPLRLAYVHLVESRVSGDTDGEEAESCDPFIDAWAGTSPVILTGGFTPESARQILDGKYLDREIAIAFGRSFISNPDLVFKIKNNVDLNLYQRDTFYKAMSPDGYVDYPFSSQWEVEHSTQAWIRVLTQHRRSSGRRVVVFRCETLALELQSNLFQPFICDDPSKGE